MTRRAVLLGATGLIGGHVLSLLSACPDYSEVVVITRRALDMPSTKCHNVVGSLEQLDQMEGQFHGADVFCCLGTTLRNAGSREAFRAVDYGYVVAAAELAARQQCPRFIMVSAVNADVSGLSFYARVKGEAELAVAACEIPFVGIMQPSLLQGHRQEFRAGEELGQAVLGLVKPLVAWSRASWLPIDARQVAEAMVSLALFGPSQGVERLRFGKLNDWANKLSIKE